MVCTQCRRSNRALFTRILPGRAYSLLCGGCLDEMNATIAAHLRRSNAQPRPLRSSVSVPAPTRPSWFRIAFPLPSLRNPLRLSA